MSLIGGTGSGHASTDSALPLAARMASTSNGARNGASLAFIVDAAGQHDNAAKIANPAEINFAALSERVLTVGEAESGFFSWRP